MIELTIPRDAGWVVPDVSASGFTHVSGLTLIGATLLCGLATAATARAERPQQVEIIAHRGASYDAPENTLAAFELAWEQGADGVEGDFYLTADGHVVCIHDRTTKRTTDGKADLDVRSATLAELRQLDVGRWKDERFAGRRIPTLAEVLAVVPPGKKIYVEIKAGPEMVEPVRRVVAASALRPKQIVVIAFDAEVVAETRRRMPNVKAYWLTSYRRNGQTGEWSPSLGQVLATLERVDAHGLSTNANTNVVDEAFVAALREKGYEFHTWTVNDGALARRFRDLSVDSITTDRPGWLREQLRHEPE